MQYIEHSGFQTPQLEHIVLVISKFFRLFLIVEDQFQGFCW